MEKVFLKISQNSQENTCARVFIKKETLAQVFSCGFCKIFINKFFTEHLRMTTLIQLEINLKSISKPS